MTRQILLLLFTARSGKAAPPPSAGRLLRVGLALGSLLLRLGNVTASEPDLCFACGDPINGPFYSMEDKVTLQRRHICKECETTFPACFVCGLPARTSSPGAQVISDGRAICARDAQTAVLQVDEGKRVCLEAWENVERLLSRFISFPEKNVRIRIVDRVHLLELFKVAGNDYECPNVWGFTQTHVAGRQFDHQISVLGAMPLCFFQATCAHEYAHTWLNENVTGPRRTNLSKDAEEGFCELVSYLFMDSLHDEEAKARILHNTYTRGQVDLFVAAEQRLGFNDVVEWMKAGADDRLNQDDPDRLRKMISPQRPSAPAPVVQTYYHPAPAPAPSKLALKAVFWDENRPTALINGQTFAINEQAKVRLGSTNVTLRCLAIHKDAVRIRVANSNQDQDLILGAR